MRASIVILLALVLCGCGPDLVTDYAATDARQASVNGVTALHAGFEADWELRRSWMLSDRLDDQQTTCLIHVAQSSGPPSVAAQRWLRTWLEAESGRQAVIILRDGNVAPFLCRRWAGEARSEALRVGPPLDVPLVELATRLDRRAEDEEDPMASPGPASAAIPVRARSRRTDDDPEADPESEIDGEDLGLSVVGARRQPVIALAGLGLTTAPATLEIGSVPQAHGMHTLVQATTAFGQPQPLIAELDVGSSRLVVVANATGLVDGALPDPAARALLAALRQDLVEYRSQHSVARGAAIVGRLTVRRGEDDGLDMLSLLFSKPPISWVAWHLLGVLTIFLLWKGRHLGRRQPIDDRQHDRFERHVDALAGHLRDQHAARAAASALATWHALPGQPPADADAAAQAAWLDRTNAPSAQRTPPP
jgi:hypothetical protein